MNSNIGKASLTIPFFIKTAFYDTWWFKALVILFILFLIYIAYSFRIRQLTRVHQLRNEISSDLHDDIGSTLSSVYYSAELLQQQGENHPELRSKIANNISTNTRDLVERMRDIVWSIHPDNDALPEMAVRMREYIHRLDLPENLQIDFECETHELRNFSLNMKARRNLYLVFKEATNNAIKYSKATDIHIKLKVDREELHLTISDNGNGFDPDSVSGGNGLRTMKQRIEEIGGKYRITQLNPGTAISAIVGAD
jgi:signal transduction histidine kinase